FPVIGDPASRLVVGRRPRPSPPADAPGTVEDTAVLEVRDLVVDFRARGRRVRAVDHVSLACRAGEIIALVGQSGSGKTTPARSVLGLQLPSSGPITHAGARLPTGRRDLLAYRREVQFVLQDPSASLNPKHTV